MTNTLNKIMHNGDEYILPRQKALVITLTSAGWSNNEQTVTATGVTANNSIIISPVPTYMSDYTDAKIYCSAQGTDSLTFTCDSTPASDIEVNVLILSAEAGSTPTPGGWQPGADTLLYMKFNDNLDDDSGNSNTMTGSGIGYETVSGTTKCVKLTNVNGGISGPNNLVAPVGTGDFTASFWVKPVNTATALPVLFSNSSSSSPRPGIQMYITYGTALGSYTNKVLFFIADANHVGESTTSASSLIGTWHHFLFTRANGVCSGYIDGVQEMTSWTENTSLSGVNSLYILNRANEPGQKWQDTGTCMSELIIEKKGWSAQDVSDYFDQTKSTYGIS